MNHCGASAHTARWILLTYKLSGPCEGPLTHQEAFGSGDGTGYLSVPGHPTKIYGLFRTNRNYHLSCL